MEKDFDLMHIEFEVPMTHPNVQILYACLIQPVLGLIYRLSFGLLIS